MDRKTYYVTVQHAEIMEDPTAFNFDFVIEANDEELDQLQELFENTAEAELSTYRRVYIPSPIDQFDEENTFYDDNLREVYKKIHQLGHPETKAQIEKMHILQG
jgi:hypothetical protein